MLSHVEPNRRAVPSDAVPVTLKDKGCDPAESEFESNLEGEVD